MALTLDRVAGAPISWGVCEVPGWGLQLPAERVLAELRGLGLGATELGPAGFLPAEPARLKALLDRNGLRLAGGFVPAVLHRGPDASATALAVVERAAAALAAAGAGVLVLAADSGGDGYDRREELDGAGWSSLLDGLELAGRACRAHGLDLAVHPHVGTVVERRAEVERLLAGSAVGLCLDTGHLLIGGTDPAELAARVPERVVHVHLKDVDAGLAGQVVAGEIGYAEAVRAGLYPPLGRGAVDAGAVVAALEGAGYRGWYVLEQDTVLAAEPPPGTGPAGEVRASLEHLLDVAGGTGPRRAP